MRFSKKGIAVLRLPSRRNTLRPIERPLAWLAGLALALCAGTAAGCRRRPAWRSGTPSGRRWPSFPSSTGWCSKRRTSPADVGYLKEQGSTPFAYLSVGEFDGDAAAIADSGLAGQERGPQPSLEQPGNGPRRAELAGAPAQARRGLRKQGYAGLFLDTLDSFQLQAESAARASAGRWPVSSPSCIARSRASSCFQSRFRSAAGVARRRVGGGRGVDPCRLGRRCRAIPRGAQDDRDWLKGHLDALRAQGMPIVAIDYLPPERRDERARSLRACVAKATCRSSAPRRWTTWG